MNQVENAYWPAVRSGHRQVETWQQIEGGHGPGTALFRRDEAPHVVLTERGLQERAKEPRLIVLLVRECAARVPKPRTRGGMKFGPGLRQFEKGMTFKKPSEREDLAGMWPE